MTRLTYEELVDLERWAADDLSGDEKGGVWRLVDEVRALRAAAKPALTDEEREALRCVRNGESPDDVAKAALDRLLKDGGEP